MIAFVGRSFSFSMVRRLLSRLGSKVPLQGTKRNITAYVWGRMQALGLSSLRRKLLLAIISVNLSLDSAKSNSSKKAGRLKIAPPSTVLGVVGQEPHLKLSLRRSSR